MTARVHKVVSAADGQTQISQTNFDINHVVLVNMPIANTQEECWTQAQTVHV